MRRSFVVGITGPRPPAERESDVDEQDRPPLTFAPAYTAQLRSRLVSFGYPDSELATLPTADPAVLEHLLEATLNGPGTVIVHLLAHGEKHPQTDKLHLVTDTGELTKGHVESWLEAVYAAPPDERPSVLFVLDVCHAGVATLPLWSQRLPAADRRAWVLAACGAESTDLAYDGRLTRALAEVLHRFATDWLRVSEQLPYIPFARICREVGDLIREYSSNGPPQQIRSTAFEAHEQHLGDQLEFFPNPRYTHREINQSLRALTDVALRPVVDEILDVDHFLLRLTDRADISEAARANSYQGRSRELQILSSWLAAGGPAVQIITGKAGTGKSALLSVLVCAAHPRLREPTTPLWRHLPITPGVVADLAVVHARHRSIADITASIAHQWNLDSTNRQDSLADRVRHRFPTDPPTLIVDALDEAERPADTDIALLRPLMTATRPDGRPLCRILLAARDHPDLSALFALARSNWSVLNLDHVSPAVLRDDLRRYIRETLLANPEYHAPEQQPIVMTLADTIASTLTVDHAALPCGEFLIAGLYTRALLRQPRLASTVQAADAGRAVPRDLRELVALDVAHRGVHPWAGPTLSALAFGEGTGLPEELIRAIAGAFADSEPRQADIRSALDVIKYYLRQDVGPDGSTVYRLFHQGLVDRLREQPLLHTQPGSHR